MTDFDIISAEQIETMADTMIECADRAEVTRMGDAFVAMFPGHNNATIEAALAYALAGCLAAFPSEEVPKMAVLAAISHLALRIGRELDLETVQ